MRPTYRPTSEKHVYRTTPEKRFSVTTYKPISRKWRAGVTFCPSPGPWRDGLIGLSACALGRGVLVTLGPRWVYNYLCGPLTA